MTDDGSSNYWPVQSLRAALACFVLGVVLFTLLYLFEKSGGNLRGHWLGEFIRAIGGRWGIAAILGSLGAFLLVMALIGRSKSDG